MGMSKVFIFLASLVLTEARKVVVHLSAARATSLLACFMPLVKTE